MLLPEQANGRICLCCVNILGDFLYDCFIFLEM